MGVKIIQPPAFQRPSGKLYLGNPQNDLVDSAVTRVLIDTIPAEYTDGIENGGSSWIIPVVAGYYSIVGQVMFNNVIADKGYESVIKVNTVIVCRNFVHASLVLNVAALVCLPCHYVGAGERIDLFATSYAGVNTVDISSGETLTFLAVQRVR